MEKKYLAKIIATDNEGLQIVSACSAGAKAKVSEIKYDHLIKNFVDLEKIINVAIKSNQKTILLAIYNNQNQRRYIGVKLD